MEPVPRSPSNYSGTRGLLLLIVTGQSPAQGPPCCFLQRTGSGSTLALPYPSPRACFKKLGSGACQKWHLMGRWHQWAGTQGFPAPYFSWNNCTLLLLQPHGFHFSYTRWLYPDVSLGTHTHISPPAPSLSSEEQQSNLKTLQNTLIRTAATLMIVMGSSFNGPLVVDRLKPVPKGLSRKNEGLRRHTCALFCPAFKAISFCSGSSSLFHLK